MRNAVKAFSRILVAQQVVTRIAYSPATALHVIDNYASLIRCLDSARTLTSTNRRRIGRKLQSLYGC